MPASSFCARPHAQTLGSNPWPKSLGGKLGDKGRDGIDHFAIDVTWPIVLLRAALAFAGHEQMVEARQFADRGIGPPGERHLEPGEVLQRDLIVPPTL